MHEHNNASGNALMDPIRRRMKMNAEVLMRLVVNGDAEILQALLGEEVRLLGRHWQGDVSDAKQKKKNSKQSGHESNAAKGDHAHR